MKRIFLLLLCLYATELIGQIGIDRNDRYLLWQKNPQVSEAPAPLSLVSLYGGYYLNSNAVTNRFLQKNFIDDELKSQVEKRLSSRNRFGMDVNIGLTGMIAGKNASWVIGLNDRYFFSAGFTPDLFKIVFRGNSQYAGRNAAIGPLNLKYFDYQSLYLGMQKESKAFTIGGGLSLIRGGTFQQARLRRGNLYTPQDGTYLDMDMDFDLGFTNSSSGAVSPANGWGLAGSFNMQWKGEKGQLGFEMRDLGFISWKALNWYEGNGTYRFDGYNVNNIFGFNDSVFTTLKADSIAADLGIRRKSKRFNSLIPATFHVNYVRHINKRWSLVAGVQHMINAAYIPRGYVKGMYYAGKRFIIIPTIAYGGFGKADFELGFTKSFGDSFLISANLFYLEYLAAPSKTSGNGANISLTKVFWSGLHSSGAG